MPDTVDRKQLSRLKVGDEQVWGELFRDCYPLMCHLAFQFTKDRSASESITMDIFTDLWTRRSALDEDKPIKPYLLKAVRYRCINYLKSFHIKNMTPLEEETFLDDEILDGSYPLGRLMDDEFSDIVDKSVGELPEASRRVFEMSRADGLKYDEIAKSLGISVNTVKYHIKRSLAILREKLQKVI